MTKAQLKPVSCCLLPLWKHITFWSQLGKAEGMQNPLRLGLEVRKSYKTQRMPVLFWQLCYNRSHRCSVSLYLHLNFWQKMMENSCWKFDYFLTGIFKEKGGILSKINKQKTDPKSCLWLHLSFSGPQAFLFHCHGNRCLPMKDDEKFYLWIKWLSLN